MDPRTPATLTPPQNIAARQRDWIETAIVWASGLGAVAMFAYGVALSYSVLHQIATAAGLGSLGARAWPLGWELFMASAALNVLAEQRHLRSQPHGWRRVPWYPWTLTGLTAGGSILLNWFHPAIPLNPPPGWLVSLVYGLPPLEAVLAWHLFLQRVAHRRHSPADPAASPVGTIAVPAASEAARSDDAATIDGSPAAAPSAAPVPAPATTLPAPFPAGRNPAGPGREPSAGAAGPVGQDGEDPDRVMRRYFTVERAKGRTPSGAELDRLVGRDPRNGAGRKARARYLAEPQQPTGGETGTVPVPVAAGDDDGQGAVRLRPVPPASADPQLPQGMAADA